jgi:2-polyprenyl-3-methyl-5-hydroxy-6-metoxy-1,4-benzoquinol methylase
MSSESDSLEKIRQQFDDTPYPNIPLDKSPREDYNALFIHNLVTPYYLKYRRVVDTTGKVILDAGCGSGYKALILAEANPGAKIIGIDLSEKSIELSRQRLEHHGFDNVEFHVTSIADLAKLDQKFDYINCDEVLYLLPDPLAGLQGMKAALNPEGILRVNLHSSLQRSLYFRAQEVFKMMGLMEHSPGDMEMELVVETMQSLKETTNLRALTWKPALEKPEKRGELLSNHLLLGDKGFTIPEMFALLEAADLEFLSMVKWRHWEISDLFKEPDNLPAFWGISLEAASPAEKLHLYELLHPVHRLLDLWCTPSHQSSNRVPIDEWSDATWERAVVHLHPQLRHDKVRHELVDCVTDGRAFQMNRYFDLPTLSPVVVESWFVACLLPLWDAPQPVTALVDRYLKIRPLHPVTLEPTSPTEALAAIKRFLTQMEVFLYVLLEQK